MASTSTTNKSFLTRVLILEGHEDTIPSISYFPDGRSGDQTARRWDLKGRKEIKEAQDVCEQGINAGVSRDGRWVVTAGGDFSTGKFKVFEVETGIVTYESHSWMINCIDISGDNTLLASGAKDKQRGYGAWKLANSWLVHSKVPTRWAQFDSRMTRRSLQSNRGGGSEIRVLPAGWSQPLP